MPLSVLYWGVTALRNFFFNKGWMVSKAFSFPIISVGNITVGGTGKTPHVEYLIRLLGAENVAVLSRGYGRKTKGFLPVDENSTPETCGDEPVQIKRKFPALSFFVGEDRVGAVTEILENFKPKKAILLDDAYQHRKINPGLKILLVDYNRPIHKDYVFPAGNLRESSRGLLRSNMVIISKCPFNLGIEEKEVWIRRYQIKDSQSIYFTTVDYGELVPHQQKEIGNIADYEVLLLTGIANPKPLSQYLEKRVAKIHAMRFSDHYSFTSTDLSNIEERFKAIKTDKKLVITTEKDKTRLDGLLSEHPTLGENLFHIPIKVGVLFGEEDQLKNKIINYVDSI